MQKSSEEQKTNNSLWKKQNYEGSQGPEEGDEKITWRKGPRNQPCS